MSTTYTDLRQRMIDGDTTITAAQLDKARRDEEFAGLQAEAEAAARDRSAEQDRQARLDQLRADAVALAEKDFTTLQKHYRTAVDSLRALRQGMADFNRDQHRIQAEASRTLLDGEDFGQEIPAKVNPEFELDRLISEAKTTAIPWHVSRLHDEETRALIAEARGEGVA